MTVSTASSKFLVLLQSNFVKLPKTKLVEVYWNQHVHLSVCPVLPKIIFWTAFEPLNRL